MYSLVILEGDRVAQLFAADITGVAITGMFVEDVTIQFGAVFALEVAAFHRAPIREEVYQAKIQSIQFFILNRSRQILKI